MLNKKICIVGTGQIGSRHFESIIKENFPYDIFAVDPNSKSQNLLKKKWTEVSKDKTSHKLFQLDKLNDLPENLDLVIISTPSQNRAELIKNLSSKIKPCYWIIEKVLAQSSEDLEVIKYATEKAKGIYVNNGHRLTKFYQYFKSKFFGQRPLRVTVEGGAWGLELMTAKRRLILRPMEQLQAIKLGSVLAETIDPENEIDKDFKPGLFLQTKNFLEGNTSAFCTLSEQVENIKIYSKIAGYL